MAVNLASKYSKALDQVYTLGSLTMAAFKAQYDWAGVKTVSVYNLTTQALVDYTRTGANRYGTPAELQDTKVDYSITKDKAFSTTIDLGNYTQQMMVKTTGAYIKSQMEEQVIPEWDTYALTVLLASATTASQVPTPAALTKSNAYESFLTLNAYLDNAKVPQVGRICFVTPAAYNFIKQDSSFIKDSELGQKMLINGKVGEIDNVSIVKAPASYFPANTAMIITHPSANVFPKQIEKIKVHDDAPGISGWLIEGRFLYDAFTLTNKIKACAAWKTA